MQQGGLKELNSFVNSCRDLEFYNTESTINYGDKLITLSTCEYSQKNGRMVVIAKKIKIGNYFKN